MAVLAQSRKEHFGLRPMDPLKDLKGVADLIEEAFAADLDRSGQNALRELRWLSRLKPLLWWMITFNPEHGDFLSGFVWEEDNRVVGNITVNQSSPGSRRWLISNVAVAKEYRQRGIARGLMYAALELVNEYHGVFPIYHFDFYRIANADEASEIGCEDYFYGDGICLIEWPENVATILPKKRIAVRFKNCFDQGFETRREIQIATE